MSQQFVQRLRTIARTLEAQFLGKQETIRLLILSVLAGEHIALIGPPGTAKSAVVRAFAQLIDLVINTVDMSNNRRRPHPDRKVQ